MRNKGDLIVGVNGIHLKGWEGNDVLELISVRIYYIYYLIRSNAADVQHTADGYVTTIRYRQAAYTPNTVPTNSSC